MAAAEAWQKVERLLREDSASRRDLLRAAPAVLGTLLLAGSAAPAAAHQPRAVSTPRPHPPTAAKPAARRRVPTLHRPVFTLREFRNVVPGHPFPADAVALTIDDGPHPVWTPKILKLLDHHHVPACSA